MQFVPGNSNAAGAFAGGRDVNKKSVSNRLEKFVTIVFLGAGPILGVTIAVVWLVGLVLGLVAVLTR